MLQQNSLWYLANVVHSNVCPRGGTNETTEWTNKRTEGRKETKRWGRMQRWEDGGQGKEIKVIRYTLLKPLVWDLGRLTLSIRSSPREITAVMRACLADLAGRLLSAKHKHRIWEIDLCMTRTRQWVIGGFCRHLGPFFRVSTEESSAQLSFSSTLSFNTGLSQLSLRFAHCGKLTPPPHTHTPTTKNPSLGPFAQLIILPIGCLL